LTEATAFGDQDLTRLVDRAVQRDSEAFGALYDAHVEALYRYLYYRLGNHAEAEDLTEQVFLKAWQAIDRFQWQGKPFAAWLYRLAHNALIDYLRTRKPTAPLDDQPDAQMVVSGDWVETRLQSDQLVKALDLLTQEQRNVVVLKFIQGMENDEIARIMQKKEGAIRALQMRALMAMRRILMAEDEA
jgi:RNA polymerase sigma-70 factor (ECF subfamily)